jgi:hypothetical protein
VRNHIPSKHLKAQSKSLKKKRSVQREVQVQDEYEEDDSHMEHEFQGQDMSLLNEESAIINIQRKLSSSKSNSLRRQGRDMSPSGSEIEYPLKELKPKIGTGSQHPSKKNNSLRMNPVISTQ